jgi:ferredoxin
MSTVLYYFSGTGNSLAVARDLARELGDASVVPIATSVGKPPPAGADAIGLVFPVYMWGPPLIVADFCRALAVPPAAYVFAVATFGGSSGGALLIVRDRLAARGIRLAAGFGVRMPGNYTPLYGAPKEAAQQKCFAAEQTAVPAIARAVRERQTPPLQTGGWLSRLLGSGLYRVGSARLRGADREFWYTSRCTSCGQCVKVCPVANIELKDGHPAWLHHCEQCMACLQWCPQEAIEHGRRTPGRRRYRHPGVTAKDLMLRT